MRPFVTALCCLLVLTAVASPATAQYVFLDTNGDGQCDYNDALTSAITSIDIYFDTNHNGDGSVATCATGEPLSFLSYEFILHAYAAGSVTYGAYTNLMTGMTTNLGTSSSSSDFYTGFAGSTALPPGRYKVGTLAVAVLGTPFMWILTATSLNGAYLTGFGSQCPGRDLDYELKLGPNPANVTGPGDFTSACGIVIPSDVKRTTWGAIKNLYR